MRVPLCVRSSWWLPLLLLLLLGGARAAFNGTQNELGCRVEPRDELGPDCRPLIVYNQLEWARMSASESLELARQCACELANLDWEYAFDQHPSVHRVRAMVRGVLGMAKYADKERNYPPQLWSDTDTIVRGLSIYLSTRDYFNKRRSNDSWSWLKRADFERHLHLSDMRYVCLNVALDKQNYYQYMENLQRINPLMFFALLRMNDAIDLIYQASKACKLFLMHRLSDFQLRPAMSEDFYAPREILLRPLDLAALNELTVPRESGHDEALDEAMRDASLQLANCSANGSRWPAAKLELECPMMLVDATPTKWYDSRTDLASRSQSALKCGCQLLLHNDTWLEMARDPNVQVLSDTLSNYMKLHYAKSAEAGAGAQPARVRAHAYAHWFEGVMGKFSKSKRMAVKEVVKFKRLSDDPTSEINGKTNDEERALELIRSGCFRVYFNYRARDANRRDFGERHPSEFNGDQEREHEHEHGVKLVQYLDSLQYISPDPGFVFHLILQDPSLFKIYAVSRMCEPFVR